MAPIYESDIAQSRWDKADWENYELWEKVAQRHRRKHRLWIAATAVVFAVLSSIPIVIDRADKWSTLAATRRLGEEINRIKRAAGVEHVAYRLRFVDGGKLEYRIERAPSCTDPHPQVVRTGRLFKGEEALAKFALMSPAAGLESGIPGLITEICYDYLSGSDTVLKDESVAGFGIAPVKDLAQHRQEHLSILLLNGPSASVVFD
jgi:hypothetical protein